MKVEVHNRCEDFTSYRAARVKSLFNAESGANFDLVAEIPDDPDWSIGVIVGPSGSGKSSIGRALWGGEAFYEPDDWPADRPIVDCIAPEGDFNEVTGALAQVGLGDVPAWLRPYQVLSTGQQFRANLARVLCEAPARVVIDEFTSVVDRQIAKIGAGAFAKAWRRTGSQAVLLTCHYDVLDWLEPDWVFDTARAELARGCLQYRRPQDRSRDPGRRLGAMAVLQAASLPRRRPHALRPLLRGIRGGRAGRAPGGLEPQPAGRRRHRHRGPRLPAGHAARVAGRRHRHALPQRGLPAAGDRRGSRGPAAA